MATKHGTQKKKKKTPAVYYDAPLKRHNKNKNEKRLQKCNSMGDRYSMDEGDGGESEKSEKGGKRGE